jgi:hypothetical protein
MELNFSELENTNSDNYWENYNETEKKTKKKVSFNDILTNMNLVVNKNGVLQKMIPTTANYEEPNLYDDYNYNTNTLDQTNNNNNFNNPNNFVQKKQNIINTPLDNSVKHSFIYNKYFKDYADAKPQEPEIRVPKTIEEYHQMLLEDKIKSIEDRKRIAQIKSTKLLFTTNGAINNNTTNGQTNIRPTNNGLRMMRFN